MKPKSQLQEEARRLRAEGKSVKEIVKILDVSQSSVSIWVRNISLTEQQKAELHSRRGHFGEDNAGSRANREGGLVSRQTYQQIGCDRAKELRPLHMMGCMLYWAEGSKGRNGIYFVNSDPNMMRLFMRFLREELDVQDAEVAIRIHCHTPEVEEIRRIETYWADVLRLPLSNVKKTYVKEAGISTRQNRLENGVCDVRVHRTDLVQHIFGAIQEYGGFDNPNWLR